MMKWFQQAAKRVDGVVDLCLEEVRDLAEHLAQCAGLFVDRDHLHHHIREQPGLCHSRDCYCCPVET